MQEVWGLNPHSSTQVTGLILTLFPEVPWCLVALWVAESSSRSSSSRSSFLSCDFTGAGLSGFARDLLPTCIGSTSGPSGHGAGVRGFVSDLLLGCIARICAEVKPAGGVAPGTAPGWREAQAPGCALAEPVPISFLSLRRRPAQSGRTARVVEPGITARDSQQTGWRRGPRISPNRNVYR